MREQNTPSAAGPRHNNPSDDGPSPAPEHSWLRNRFWLVLPVLALNASLAPHLPQTYAPEAFSAGIPAGLAAAENALRLLVCAVPLLMPLAPCRPALLLYGCGLGAYAGAWLAVMAAPGSTWSASLIGFTAPAWTSLFWLAGIGWGSRLRFVPRYRPWMYWVAAVSFTAVHTLSTGLVWIQLT